MDVSRYVVTYGRVGSDSASSSSVAVDEPSATSVTLSDLEAGVQYEVTVQGFADLPGSVSSAAMVMLRGKEFTEHVCCPFYLKSPLLPSPPPASPTPSRGGDSVCGWGH